MFSPPPRERRRDQLFEGKQWQHPPALAAMKNELFHRWHDALHTLQVETIPSNGFRFVIFSQDIEKARRISLRADHPLRFVAFGLLYHLRGLTPRIGHDTFPVAICLLHQAVAVLQGADNVMERVPHLTRGINNKEAGFGDQQAGLISVQEFLKGALRLLLHLHSAVGHGVVDGVASYRAAQRDLRRGMKNPLGIVRPEKKLYGVLDAILDKELQLDDVFIASEH